MFIEITFYTSLSNIMFRYSVPALFSHFLVAIFLFLITVQSYEQFTNTMFVC